MEQSQLLYEIAYDKTRQLVIVYPKWRGARPNTQVIGTYTPENARANLEDYVKELGVAINEALARVGEADYEPFKVSVIPLDGSPEVVLKEIRGTLQRVPVEDQVPVGLNTTVAQATQQELENGTPEEIPTQATKQIIADQMAEGREARLAKPITKKLVAKKAAKKKTPTK